MKNIYLLGATGSIGTQTLDVIRNCPERFRLVAFSAGYNIDLTRKIIEEFEPECVSMANSDDARTLADVYKNVKFESGESGLVNIATYVTSDEAEDLVINALMGGIGLLPTLKAIEARRDVALANKETLVMAGHLVMSKVREYGVNLFPVDSEHSAIFQCLQGENPKEISKLIITASGGSFRDYSRDMLVNVTKEDALNHPNWKMGEKITIDSATMMNKGLEVIEAHWMFGLPYEQIETIIHPQSIVHSMVEFKDTSVIAHLGTADMKIPIAYAMNFPNREVIGNTEFLNLARVGSLDFKEMDFDRYPCLRMAYDAGKLGGTFPLVLNASNEEAVFLFLEGKISFLQIEDIVSKALNRHAGIKDASLEEILIIDAEVRSWVRATYS